MNERYDKESKRANIDDDNLEYKVYSEYLEVLKSILKELEI